jgi:hypothetical protein
MSRRALLWLAGLALVVGALLVTDSLLWEPGLSEKNLKRLRAGMTPADVEELRGGALRPRGRGGRNPYDEGKCAAPCRHAPPAFATERTRRCPVASSYSSPPS